MKQLRDLKLPTIKEVRGIGLMIGVEVTVEAKQVIDKVMAGGLLAVPAGTNVVRFLPPLNVTKAEVDEAVDILAKALASIK
jgi:acetylornithine/succinyldiaminopimelate/putrescine aminotransferase